jgi:uncharacterized protein with PIN domain
MKFLVVAKWLRELNYDVVSVYEQYRGLDDKDILNKDFSENRILITKELYFYDWMMKETKVKLK